MHHSLHRATKTTRPKTRYFTWEKVLPILIYALCTAPLCIPKKCLSSAISASVQEVFLELQRQIHTQMEAFSTLLHLLIQPGHHWGSRHYSLTYWMESMPHSTSAHGFQCYVRSPALQDPKLPEKLPGCCLWICLISSSLTSSVKALTLEPEDVTSHDMSVQWYRRKHLAGSSPLQKSP